MAQSIPRTNSNGGRDRSRPPLLDFPKWQSYARSAAGFRRRYSTRPIAAPGRLDSTSASDVGSGVGTGSSLNVLKPPPVRSLVLKPGPRFDVTKINDE